MIVAVLVVLPGCAGLTIPPEEEAAGAVGSRPGRGAPGRFLPEGSPVRQALPGVRRREAALPRHGMTVAPGLLGVRRVAVPAVAATGVLAVGALAALRKTGNDGFATDPFGALALVAGAVVAAFAGSRLRAVGNARAGALATWLGVSLVGYVAAAVWAVGAVSNGFGIARIAVAVWNTAWIAPLVLAQLTASTAVRRGPGTAWEHRLVAGTMSAVAVANLVLTTPEEPFAGLPTIAPEAWRQAFAPLDAAATLLGLLAILLIPVRLWRAALGSRGPARAGIGVAAAASTIAPLTVAFCVLLAVARNPGDVDPSLGSVAFLVTLAGGSAAAAACAVLVGGRGPDSRAVGVIVRTVALAAAGLVVAALGTLLAAPGPGLGPTATALSTAGLAVAVFGASWFASGKLADALGPPREPAAPHGDPPATPSSLPVPPTPRLPGLTPRESEVLALLAEGASNAGIAAQLVVSERTVDAHLRAVFTKLDLQQAPEANRRVQAARIWLQRADRPAGTPE